MRLNWKEFTILMVTVLLIAAMFAIQAQPQNAQASQTRRGETIEEADVSQFPIVEYVAEKSLAGEERDKWEAKGKK